jgi:hypothetical protein
MDDQATNQYALNQGKIEKLGRLKDILTGKAQD